MNALISTFALMLLAAPLSQGWVCRIGVDVDLRLATCPYEGGIEGMVRGVRVGEAQNMGFGSDSAIALWCNTGDDPSVVLQECESIAEDTGYGFDISVRRGDGFTLPSLYARVQVFDVMVGEVTPCTALMMDLPAVRRIRECREEDD